MWLTGRYISTLNQLTPPVGLTRPAGILDDTRRRRHFAVSVYTSMVGTGHNDNQLSPSVPPNGSWECIYRERKKVRCVAK